MRIRYIFPLQHCMDVL